MLLYALLVSQRNPLIRVQAMPVLFDEKNNLIYADQITGVRGVQLDHGQAAADAYKKAADLVRKKIFLDMKRKVFD